MCVQVHRGLERTNTRSRDEVTDSMRPWSDSMKWALKEFHKITRKTAIFSNRCIVTLSVLKRAWNATFGGGRPVINHWSQQNTKEMQLFFSPSSWWLQRHLSCSVRRQDKKSEPYKYLHFHACMHISAYECVPFNTPVHHQSHLKLGLRLIQ